MKIKNTKTKLRSKLCDKKRKMKKMNNPPILKKLIIKIVPLHLQSKPVLFEDNVNDKELQIRLTQMNLQQPQSLILSSNNTKKELRVILQKIDLTKYLNVSEPSKFNEDNVIDKELQICLTQTNLQSKSITLSSNNNNKELTVQIKKMTENNILSTATKRTAQTNCRNNEVEQKQTQQRGQTDTRTLTDTQTVASSFNMEIDDLPAGISFPTRVDSSPPILVSPSLTPLYEDVGRFLPERNQSQIERENGPRRRHAEIPRPRTFMQAVVIGNEVGAERTIPVYSLGQFREACKYCRAKYFDREPKDRSGERQNCCKKGDVILEPMGMCPRELREYLTDDSPMAGNFRENIRSINSLFSMATFKTTERMAEGQGRWIYTIQGQAYHYTFPIPMDVILNHRDNTGNNHAANNIPVAIPPASPVLQNNQYYFVDIDEAVERRSTFLGDRVPRLTLLNIERMLRRTNPHIRAYMTVAELIREEERRNGAAAVRDIVIGFRDNINRERRNFALPESRSEIAGIFHGEPPFRVDLAVYSRADDRDVVGRRHELKNLNKLSDPMTYPLLFPHGENGYDYNLTHQHRTAKKITFREFYRYRIHCRPMGKSCSILHNSGKLFQQYIIDAWIKAEANELWWLRAHERQVRLAGYENLLRSLRARAVQQNLRVGSVLILPSNFQGGVRHQNRQYLDAMNIVGRHGKPDLFITFTCSPKWAEITENLEYKQKWQNRPDLVCRVFNGKLTEFLDDIIKKQLYGTVKNFFYVIEFQKRGLPHAHILITYHEESKLRTIETIDNMICAEIPNPETEPDLYGVVVENYLHHKCGSDVETARCRNDDGRCSKFFPKPFRQETALNYHLATVKDGRPEYRRRNLGFTAQINGQVYDNRDVVPYNRYAALKYRCHINFEGVGTLASIKYLYKYVTKGEDMITVEQVDNERRLLNYDEIRSYIECRYVSSMEAAWRLFEFKTSDRSHCVICLPVHLKDRQTVIFEEDEDEYEIRARLSQDTKLTAYFMLNQTDGNARQYTYLEIPEHYVWDGKNARWTPRKKREKVIGAIVEISPNIDDELYCLRQILLHIRGPTSFDDILTFDNGARIYATYREVCDRLHLFDREDFYEHALREASLVNRPSRLRRFYALILNMVDKVGGNTEQTVVALWPIFKDPHMIADYLYRGITASKRVASRLALNNIKAIVREIRPDFTFESIGLIDEEAVSEEELEEMERAGIVTVPNAHEGAFLDEPEQVVALQRQYRVDLLTPDQRRIYDSIIYTTLKTKGLLNRQDVLQHFELNENSIRNAQLAMSGRQDLLFFIDGPAGTGKTFLYKVVALKFLTKRLTHHCHILSVAYTGIAASLLFEGKTLHSAFRLNLNLHEHSTAGWPVEHERSQSIKKIDIILWDEVSMTSKFALDAIDRYLRDITGHNAIPFGGKVVMFGGDFRQTLPIVVRGTRSLIVSYLVKSSLVWRHVTNHFGLTTNLRAARTSDPDTATEYASWLLEIGEGKAPFVTPRGANVPKDLIKIPPQHRIQSRDSLIRWVYENVDRLNDDHLGDKVILCPTNQGVEDINKFILDLLPGESKSYFSTDSLIHEPQYDFYVPQEILHATKASNLPPHELILKKGSIVMLLKNIDVQRGHCNGCRFLVRSLHEHRIELETLTGTRSDDILWLPRMIIQAEVPGLTRPLRRVQFPLKLAFAMTINKSQGQTFNRVGINLPNPCFAHGQLYVAFSRAGNPANVKIHVDYSNRQGIFAYRDGTCLTRNVVYTEAFLNPTPILRPLPNHTRLSSSSSPSHLNQTRPGYNTQSVIMPTTTTVNDNSGVVDITNQNLNNLEHPLPLRVDPWRARIERQEIYDRTEHDLRRRIAVDDSRPGTSGFYFTKPPPLRPIYDESDSD